jgi:catechol 2,3-dioxygenase-like lactoylglutathione lyase family enzyme
VRDKTPPQGDPVRKFYRDSLGWPTEGNSGYFTDPDGHLFEIAWNSSQ